MTDILAQVREMVELMKWLSMDHDVSHRTKAESDYWAKQFLLACNKAKKIKAPAVLAEIERMQKALNEEPGKDGVEKVAKFLYTRENLAGWVAWDKRGEDGVKENQRETVKAAIKAFQAAVREG